MVPWAAPTDENVQYCINGTVHLFSIYLPVLFWGHWEIAIADSEQLFRAEEFVSSVWTKNEYIALLFTKSCKQALTKNMNDN